MALPDRIFAQASPHSVGGQSMFASKHLVQSARIGAFASHPVVLSSALDRLSSHGFEILQTTPLTVNIAGSPDAFERAFRTKIVEREIARVNGPTSTFLDSPDTDMLGLISTVGTSLGDVLEGVALEVPRTYFGPSATPPDVDYWHLDVPVGVASASNAAQAHVLGITGWGVRVAMVDSGWFRHPYFVAQGYDVDPVVLAPAATLPEVDESGHGTGESANILGIAPGCKLLPVKANFVNTIGAFNAAVALQPDIISCSWGSHSPFVLSAADVALAASVAAAVADGITVVFSAGNGHAGFPGQHPDVISAGGVYLDRDGSLQASNYSSGFASLIYPGRAVPDVCGLVGMRPKAIYIVLPVEPGDSIDEGNAGVFPDGDETAPDDGWAVFSGTSAAAPQIAGAAALIKQVAPSLTPEGVKNALMRTARDVSEGFCSPVGSLHNGLPAAPGPDGATGSGLADVFAATTHAWNMAAAGTTAGAVSDQAFAELAAAYYRGMAVGAAYLQGVADAAAALSLT